ncbi:MAG TPA: hypothetical protein VFZ61_06370 [Polyangiales bacterium]
MFERLARAHYTQAALLAVLAVVGLKHWVPAGLAISLALAVGGLAFWAQTQAGEPDRHSARSHAWTAVMQTLLVTWAAALAVAFAYDAWASPEARQKQDTFALLLIIAPNVGGILALMRSVRTRSETGATLRELSQIRVSALSSPVIEEAVRALEAKDPVALVGSLARMLRLTVSLPLARELCDKASLWVRDDRRGVWFMLATSQLAIDDFELTMPIVKQATPGAGIVANLAVASPPAHLDCRFEADVFLCGSTLQSHPWFVPHSQTTSVGMVATLLRNESGVIGVLCLTTESAKTVPVTGPEARELVDVMRFWAHSFTSAVRCLRVFARAKPAPQGADKVPPDV